MKNVLILKTPFKGIGDYINDLVELTGHNFCFIEYSRDETTPYDNYGKSNVYDPNEINLNNSMEERSILKEITARRVSDIIRELGGCKYDFKKEGKGLVLYDVVGDWDIDSSVLVTEQGAINRVINLIYRDIDMILPIFNSYVNSSQFRYAIREQYDFLYKIQRHKPSLRVLRGSIDKVDHKENLMRLLSN